jgi:hypothetical protein
MLNEYRRQVQRFIRDSKQQFVDIGDIDSYINRARREVAMRTQSIRILTPISGSVVTVQVTNPGSGYTNPTATISTPDAPDGALPNPAGLQATVQIQQIGGQISNISVSDGGSGYFAPQVTISDPTGTGAEAVAFTNPISVTQLSQEIYAFKDIPLSQFPGVGEVFQVKSVSIIFSNYRYSLPCYSMSVYQSQIRQYPQQYLYVPVVFAQYGQGTNGSLFMYPIPSQGYQLEMDCFCLPSPLINDQSPEAIPGPWTDAVPIGAAVYAFEELQSLNAASYYQKKFDDYVHRYSAYAHVGRMLNPYGRV